MNQTVSLAKEIYPVFNRDGKKVEANEAKWELIHNRLAHEYGVTELAQRYYSFVQKGPMGQDWPTSGFFTYDHVCEQFVISQPPSNLANVDRFIKERISFIELAVRLREEEVAAANVELPRALLTAKIRSAAGRGGMRVPGNPEDSMKALNESLNASFRSQVDELNERFRRAGAALTYHNGFIQVATDEVIEREVAAPFWQLVADPTWKNVSIDMAEALDRRDSNDKDPAIFASKALESAIKIVSDLKGWTRGNESGASAYIDNLVSKSNGSFLAIWEGELLRDYFRKVRNSLGHGPGSEPMPGLTQVQTDWAIETAMSWVKTLVRRL